MNSVLQPVLATPYLNDYMLNQFSTERKLRQTPLADSFYKLLKSVRSANGAAVTPSEIKMQVSRTVSQFSGYAQQDSQEFMRFLIDRMHDELNRVSSKPGYKEMKFDKLSPAEQAEKWAEYYRARDNSVMTDLFEG